MVDSMRVAESAQCLDEPDGNEIEHEKRKAHEEQNERGLSIARASSGTQKPSGRSNGRLTNNSATMGPSTLSAAPLPEQPDLVKYMPPGASIWKSRASGSWHAGSPLLGCSWSGLLRFSRRLSYICLCTRVQTYTHPAAAGAAVGQAACAASPPSALPAPSPCASACKHSRAQESASKHLPRLLPLLQRVRVCVCV